MFSNLKKIIRTNFINIQGWHTNRKIIVIESDDWGSIRMPSKEAYYSLLNKGIRVDKSLYDSIDCLENRIDLENLFELLESHKDSKNNHPIFTFNTVVGNPNFEKIKEYNFDLYYHENLFDSYKKYHNEDLEALWRKGIEKGLIMPQFHAREHLNVGLWMRDLKNGVVDSLTAFDYSFFGLKTKTSSQSQKSYLAAYHAESQEELENIGLILKDGLAIFENIFGFKSETFIACNYVWPKELEYDLKQKGIDCFQGNSNQKAPILNDSGKLKIVRNFTGKRNKNDQIYTIRNVKFEPFENQNYDWVASALKEIEISFRYKKPAIIATHRVNYVGGIDCKNATDSREKLSVLLQEILKKWPDVEFLSSNELSRLIKNENSHT